MKVANNRERLLINFFPENNAKKLVTLVISLIKQLFLSESFQGALLFSFPLFNVISKVRYHLC